MTERTIPSSSRSSAREMEAIGRAERDATRNAGGIAFTQVVDTETGEVEDEQAILAPHGELPPGTTEE